MNTTHTSEPIEQKEKLKASRLLDELDLRDYFAAKAMQGLLAGLTPTTVWSQDEVAETAYNVADAMMKAREA
jgi:hypothetical protein